MIQVKQGVRIVKGNVDHLKEYSKGSLWFRILLTRILYSVSQQYTSVRSTHCSFNLTFDFCNNLSITGNSSLPLSRMFRFWKA
jgi:hypothetical protein